VFLNIDKIVGEIPENLNNNSMATINNSAFRKLED